MENFINSDNINMGLERQKQIYCPRKFEIIIEPPNFLKDIVGFKNLLILAPINKIINDEKINESMRLLRLD